MARPASPSETPRQTIQREVDERGAGSIDVRDRFVDAFAMAPPGIERWLASQDRQPQKAVVVREAILVECQSPDEPVLDPVTTGIRRDRSLK